MHGNETPQELLEAGRYNLLGWNVNHFVDSLVFFNLGKRDRTDILVAVPCMKQEVFPRLTDMLLTIGINGLLRPKPEHALRFGILFPEQQRICPHVFPFEEWTDPEGKKNIMSLIGNKNGRRVDMSITDWPFNHGFYVMGVLPDTH